MPKSNQQVKVSFYGLGIKPEACLANVPAAFMTSPPQNPPLDLRRRDPDFGARSSQLRTLGHVGELTLPVDASIAAEDLLAFYHDLPEDPQPLTKKQRIQKEQASLSNPDTMNVRNSKDYWHWFEAQKYFTGKVPDTNVPALLKNDNDNVFPSDPKHDIVEDLVALDDKDFYDPRMGKSNRAVIEGIAEPPPLPTGIVSNLAVRRSEDRLSMTNVLYQRLLSAIIPAQPEKIDRQSEQLSSSVSIDATDKATSSSNEVGSKRRRGGKNDKEKEKEKEGEEVKVDSAANNQYGRSAWVEVEPVSPSDLLDISHVPVDRRIAFELGSVGLLREGDLGGNWMKFLEKMIANREDAYVFERWRELREESRLLRGTINASLARIRGLHQSEDDRSLGVTEHEKSTLNKYAKYLKKVSDKKAGISTAPKSKKRN